MQSTMGWGILEFDLHHANLSVLSYKEFRPTKGHAFMISRLRIIFWLMWPLTL